MGTIEFYERQLQIYKEKFNHAYFMKRRKDAEFYKTQIKLILENIEYLKK